MRIPLIVAITYLLVQPAPPAATSAFAHPKTGSHVGDSAAHLAALELEPALAEIRRRHGAGVVRLAVLTIEYDGRGEGQ